MARAGATGGGRSYRGQRPVKWYGSLVLICLLGVALIVYSRYERQHPAAGDASPPIGAHWYRPSASTCAGRSQPNLAANPNASTSPIPGIRTDGDGVIQVAPTTRQGRRQQRHPGPLRGDVPQVRRSPRPRCRSRARPKYTNGEKCPAGTPDAGKTGTAPDQGVAELHAAGVEQPHGLPRPARRSSSPTASSSPSPSCPRVRRCPSPSSITAMLTDRAGSATSTRRPRAHGDDRAARPRRRPPRRPRPRPRRPPTDRRPRRPPRLPSPTRTTATTKPSTTDDEAVTSATARREGRRPGGRRGDAGSVRSPTPRPSSCCPWSRCPCSSGSSPICGAHGVDEAVLSLGYRPDAFLAAYPDARGRRGPPRLRGGARAARHRRGHRASPPATPASTRPSSW